MGENMGLMESVYSGSRPLTGFRAHGGADTTIAAKLASRNAGSHVLQYGLNPNLDWVMHRPTRYWIDMCLSPRPNAAKASYTDHWNADRFVELGDIFVVRPGEALKLKCDGLGRAGSATQTSIVCHIDGGNVHEWLGVDDLWTEDGLAACLNVTDRNIRALMLRLHAETTQPGFCSEAMLEMIAGQIALELARHLGTVGRDLPAKGRLAAWRLRLIDERIRTPGPAASLTELAELCNLSVRQLSRGFKESHGVSIGRYIEIAQIERAKWQLTEGKSVKSVAYELGFSSPSSFTFAFRRATGVTPKQFQSIA